MRHVVFIRFYQHSHEGCEYEDIECQKKDVLSKQLVPFLRIFFPGELTFRLRSVLFEEGMFSSVDTENR